MFADDEGNIKIASLFGGFEVVQWSYKAIEKTAFRVLGLDIKFVVQYVSESDLPTLQFLMHNLEAKYIFEDVKDLAAPCVKDRRTGHNVVSPPSDWLVFWLPLQSLASGNQRGISQQGVREEERGQRWGVIRRCIGCDRRGAAQRYSMREREADDYDR